MDQYQETFETWNKVAQLYEDKFMHLDLYNESYDFICNEVKEKNAKILEIGCGPGNITAYLLSQRPDFDLLGIDIAPNMLQLAQKNNPTATFRLMDSRNIDEITTTYEAIVCGFCFPYLSETDIEKLITDCNNLLNENGLIYISFVEGDAAQSGFQVTSSGNRCFFYFHSLEKIKTLLAGNQFENVVVLNVNYARTTTTNEVHTIVLAKKGAKK